MRLWAWRASSAVALATASFVGGVAYGRRRSESGLAFRTANAATALPPNSLVPFGNTVPEQTAPKASRASEIMKFGFPGFDNLKTFEDYVLSYDRRNRVFEVSDCSTAHWVVEHLSPPRMIYDASVDRGKCQFRPDESVHPFFRANNDDFKGSGFDRGHLAAAGNHRRTQNSVDQTFLLSNMTPQVGKGFNRGKWNELEKRTRAIARRSLNVYVCTGPLYLPRRDPDGQVYVKYRVIGKSHVAVPTHLFKVLLVEFEQGKFDLEAYVLPNEAISDSTPLASFFVPLESIERAAGFHIFEQLPTKQLRYLNGRQPPTALR